jgi:hypothetical protein
MALINLLNTEFKRARLMEGLLPDEELYYHGLLNGKTQFFKAVSGHEAFGILAVHVIRRDEDFIWESSRDLIERAIKDAGVQVRGTYVFELLAFDPAKELKTFNANELSQMLVNTARTLKPGEQSMIRYSTVYGLLQKVLDETWGKVTVKTSVEILSDKPEAFFQLLFRKLKLAEEMLFPVKLLLNDLSSMPMFKPLSSELIQPLMEDFKIKRAKLKTSFARDVYARDSFGLKSI